MLTLPQLADAVKAAPMPLPLKEQILDQVLGHHDDLLRPRRLRRATSCQCRDFEFESLRTPGYCCKHMELWNQDVYEGDPVDVDEAISLAASAAAEWEAAWAHHALGRICDDEANRAYACYEAARAAMRDAVKAQAAAGARKGGGR